MKDDFVYGFCFAIIIISVLLATQYGDHFNFLKNSGIHILPTFGEAINWKSAVFLSLIFMVFFKNMIGTFAYRIFQATMLMLLGWAFLDMFWLFKSYYMGNFLFGEIVITMLSIEQLYIAVVRNLTILAVAIPFSFKVLKFTKFTLVTLILIACYWGYLSLSRVTSPSLSLHMMVFYYPICYFVNFLPFIVSFKSWCYKSWKRFLFV